MKRRPAPRPIVITSFMDCSYFLVVDDDHTLAHCDAVGWEPSTASKADIGRLSSKTNTNAVYEYTP